MYNNICYYKLGFTLIYYKVNKLNLSKNTHLNKEEIIKSGSFFTPPHIVNIARSWLDKHINKDDVVIDFGAGYGAFISRFNTLSNKCIATDSDQTSISFLYNNIPNIKTFLENSLIKISRQKYGLTKHDRIFIIGNPPYNNTTSLYQKGKKGSIEMDSLVHSKDLGIAFLKMYSLLQPEYICVLHPFSYLIKKTNFNSLKFFRNNYILEKGLIFSSYEFENIKKSSSEFPVCLALYKRKLKTNMTYDNIQNFSFAILNNNQKFCLNNFSFIDKWVRKYPNKKTKKPSDLQFYTLRDINALKRNKTFLVGDVSNGITVNLATLYKYAWLDYFKHNFKPSNYFLYSNLSPLYSKQLDKSEVKKSLISYIYNNNTTVKTYIDTNNLAAQILNYYEMTSFEYNQSILSKILKSLCILK